MHSAGPRLDVVLIGAVMNFDGKRGAFANYIRQGRRWIAPFQYVYQQRPDHFTDEADACIYGVPNLSCSKLADYLATHVPRLRHHIVWHFDYRKEELARILAEDPPRIVAVSTTLAFYPEFLNQAIRWINARKQPTTQVVIGGKWIYDQYKVHGLSQHFEDALVACDPDYAVIDGYGEEALRQLILAHRAGDARRAQALPNIAYRIRDVAAPDDAARTPGREAEASAFADLGHDAGWTGAHYRVNALAPEQHTPGQPMIDFRKVGPQFLSSVAHVRTCSSCPFKCKFCTFPVLGGEHTLFDIEAVIAQLRQLRELGVRHLFFVDDTFNVPKMRFEKLIDRIIAEDLGMEWVSFFRAQFANERIVAKMRAAGCRMVFCGFESGNDAILRLMGKNVTVRQYRQGLEFLSRHDIEVLGSYIVGYPGETRETALDTLELVNDPRVGFSRGSLFYYDPNAPVRLMADEWDLKGFANDWSHRTMDSEAAARLHLEMIDRSTSVNTPVSDGGAWSIFNLYAHGLAFEDIKGLYREFTEIQRSQVRVAGNLAVRNYRSRFAREPNSARSTPTP